MSIRNCRLRAGYSQPEVRELLGISLEEIWKWERKEMVPYRRNIIALCNLFGVDDMELLKAEPPLTFDREAFQKALATWETADIIRATGVDEKDVCRWRHGGKPCYSRLRLLCEGFGLKPGYFLKEATA